MRNIYIYIYMYYSHLFPDLILFKIYIHRPGRGLEKRPKDHIQKTAKEGCEETSKNIKTNGQENRQ